MNRLGLFIFFIAIVGSLFACNQATESADTTKADSIIAGPSALTPVEIKDSLNAKVYNHYIKLKDLLVASDSAKAQTAASDLVIALRKLSGSDSTAELAEKIANSKELSEQRINFTALSNDMINLIKKSEIASGSIYVQYCPMANEGEGGYWLSSQEEVLNPYYGDDMLHCGEVKETIAKK
jgi:hypothetical protein